MTVEAGLAESNPQPPAVFLRPLFLAGRLFPTCKTRQRKPNRIWLCAQSDCTLNPSRPRQISFPPGCPCNVPAR